MIISPIDDLQKFKSPGRGPGAGSLHRLPINIKPHFCAARLGRSLLEENRSLLSGLVVSDAGDRIPVGNAGGHR